MAEPFFVGWDVTSSCNLRCLHCNRAAGDKSINELSLNEVKSVIDQLAEDFEPIDHISFGGGEPLMRKDIFDILAYGIIKKKLKIRINTNGTLIDNKIAKALADSKVYHVQVSIDGDKKTHDLIRGRGNFDKAIRGVKLLIKEGVNTSIRMTLMNCNRKKVKSVFDLASSLHVKRFSIGRGICSGRFKEHKKELYIKKEDYFSAIKEAFELARNKKIDFYCTDPLSIFIDEKRLKEIIHKFNPAKYIGGCIAGIAQFFISATGKIYGCGMLDIEAGDLRKQKIREIWDNSKLFKLLRKRRDGIVKDDFCSSCKFLSICGGCQAAAYYNNKKLLTKDPFCIFRDEQ